MHCSPQYSASNTGRYYFFGRSSSTPTVLQQLQQQQLLLLHQQLINNDIKDDERRWWWVVRNAIMVGERRERNRISSAIIIYNRRRYSLSFSISIIICQLSPPTICRNQSIPNGSNRIEPNPHLFQPKNICQSNDRFLPLTRKERWHARTVQY